ncbi:MAG: cupredoxin domain-containing protein [Chloroflexota bacterium]
MSQNRRGGHTRIPMIVALLSLFSILLAACEAPGVPHPLAVQAGDKTPGGGAATPSSATPDQGPVAGPACQKCDVTLKDFKLDPGNVAAKAGSVTFALKNEGRVTHAFQVEGNGVDAKAPNVGQGKTIEWATSLPPGTYTISCRISNHAERGMKGTLVVQ